MDDENTTPTTTTDDGAPQLDDDGEPTPKRKKRGRPFKGEELPITAEPPPKPRKVAEEMRDPGAAIRRYLDNVATCMHAYAELHPESDLGWVWKEVRARLPEEKGRTGAPMEKTAFHAPIIGVTKLAGFIGDVPDKEMPSQEQYDKCAESWARASTHLGMSEKVAALVSAASETVGVVGFTVAKGVKRLLLGDGDKDAKPELDGDARPDAVKVEGTHAVVKGAGDAHAI